MVKIISDSTSDLSKELIEKYDISILPLHILLGEKSFEDGINIMPENIFKWSDENNEIPLTATPTLAETVDIIKPYLDEGREVVCFSISDDMSAMGNIMRLAVEQLEAEDRVKVINSANLSTGIGLLVIEAAIMAQEGKTAQEIVERIEKIRPLVRASFVVDTLAYMRRGGKCGAITAMASSVFGLHPKIVVEKGQMDVSKTYRGKMDSVIMSYVKDMEEDLKKAKPDRVFVTHSGCAELLVAEVCNVLKRLGVFTSVLETKAGGVISCHCGPGALGVLYVAGEA